MKRMCIGSLLIIAGLFGHMVLPPTGVHADAPPFTLVKDINTAPQPASGIGYNPLFTTINNTIIFSGSTPQTGIELWRTDGTEAGTSLIKDIQIGEGSSLGYYGITAQVLSNTLLFVADDGAMGSELWRTDGTTAGTSLLKDVWPGASGSSPQNFTLVGGRVFFTAQIGEAQWALWATDGTAAGTTQLHTFTSIGGAFVALGNTLLFSAADGGLGGELWRSDGTPGGTLLVDDINPGIQSSNPSDFFVYGSMLLFSAYDMHGRELWRSDGTPGGTLLVKDIDPVGAISSNPSSITLLAGGITIFSPDRIVFSADDGSHGTELWTTDGTDAGTHLIKDINPNGAGSNPVFRGFAPNAHHGLAHTRALYAMDDGSHGNEVWITDGTDAGTLMLADAAPGANSSDPSTSVAANGLSFFTATNTAAGRQLWKTDGTPPNTAQVVSIVTTASKDSDPRDLTAFNNKLYFSATDTIYGRELWRSDGTTVELVKDVWPGSNGGVRRLLGVALGALYFTADDGTHGTELWKSDGTANGTTLVKNVAPDTGGIYLAPGYNAAALGDKLLFGLDLSQPSVATVTTSAGASLISRSARLPRSTQHVQSPRAAPAAALWRSDGSADGTTPIKTFPEVAYSSQPYALTTLGDQVLFSGIDNIAVNELWRSDGTGAGTAILTNTVKPFFGSIDSVVPFNNLAIFAVYTGTLSTENNTYASLWKTDGTAQGTQLIKPNLAVDQYDHAVSGSTLFFNGAPQDTSNDNELWKTDGTAAGTVLVKAIVSGDQGSDPHEITAGQPGEVFFVARTNMYDYQLWRSDGTDAGTTMVNNLRANVTNQEYGELAYVHGTLFFTADDGVHGWELWRSDGTAAGTTMAADLYPGAGSSNPQDLIGLNDNLYFAATGPDGTRTLWRSDGTAAGTRPLRTDVGAPLDPYDLSVVHGQLVFSAADAAHGREVWHSDGTAAGTTLLQDIVPGAGSSNPASVIGAGQRIYLTADVPDVGRELWSTAENAPIPTATPTASTPISTATPVPKRGLYLPLMQH